MIVILDYGVGNLASIKNMLKKVGVEAVLSSSQEEIAAASKLILPGIGAFDHCMQQFNKSGLRELVEKKVHSDHTPVLGVCVGCQMLMERSEEGNEAGLSWISGEVIKFRKENLPSECKVPHMSWSEVKPAREAAIYSGQVNPRFYFVHSYHVQASNESEVTGEAEYGYKFTASVGKGHIQGVQFHPEKSHRFGMELYKNFAGRF